jgi:hypothetical protein
VLLLQDFTQAYRASFPLRPLLWTSHNLTTSLIQQQDHGACMRALLQVFLQADIAVQVQGVAITALLPTILRLLLPLLC